MDFKYGEGVCAVILAVGTGVSIIMNKDKTTVDMEVGDMLVISPTCVHGGGQYGPPQQGANGNMRMHMYVHWRGFKDVDDITTIHHPTVRVLCLYMYTDMCAYIFLSLCITTAMRQGRVM